MVPPIIMKRALVLGAGGFIGGHLCNYLKSLGYWVRGADIKPNEWNNGKTDQFMFADLRKPDARLWHHPDGGGIDEVYQLAADMGGMGFIHSAETEIMRNSALINITQLHDACNMGVKRYFFSSSACVYRNQEPGDGTILEDDAYPAMPDNEYGWEKLYAERMALAYGRKHATEIRIARFQNCYGPSGTWHGGREKAPAALCRKVAEADDGGEVEVWGDGTALRDYVYVADLVRGIYTLTQSDETRPTNIGTASQYSVNELLGVISTVSGKTVTPKYVDGPVGVQARNHDTYRIRSLGWEPTHNLAAGIAKTYPWIAKQVALAREVAA